MTAKSNGCSQAFPVPAAFNPHIQGDRSCQNEGLTKREAFAMHAPPAPMAFDIDLGECQPERPQLPADLSAEERADHEAWRDSDGDCDPQTERVKAFVGAIHAHRELLGIWRARLVARRQAVWARIYADELLAELELEV